jgi:hypothetical protein
LFVLSIYSTLLLLLIYHSRIVLELGTRTAHSPNAVVDTNVVALSPLHPALVEGLVTVYIWIAPTFA